MKFRTTSGLSTSFSFLFHMKRNATVVSSCQMKRRTISSSASSLYHTSSSTYNNLKSAVTSSTTTTNTTEDHINSNNIRHVQFNEPLNCSSYSSISKNYESFNEIQLKFLENALTFVPEYGFTSKTTLIKAAESMGYPDIFHKILPQGNLDLILFFLEKSRKEMVLILLESDSKNEETGVKRLKDLGITGKIKFACETRLNLLTPYAHHWGPALSLLAEPQNVTTSLQSLAQLVDDMWYIAGDRSTDVETILAGVYSSTELFMSEDTSPDYNATYDFLNRRLQDSAVIGKTIHELTNVMNFSIQSIKGIINVGK